jgi:cytochrome c-type biogenesis protein CcmF
MNNILLVVIAFAVLFGTLLPLFADAFGWRKLSVGAPFFNLAFNLLMVVLLCFIAVGQLMRWKKDQLKNITSWYIKLDSGVFEKSASYYIFSHKLFVPTKINYN